MKILFLLTYYRPHWTGLTKYAARLAEVLSKKNKVEVLCVQHNKDTPVKEIISGVNVYREPYIFKFSRSLIAPFLPVKLYQRLLRNDVLIIYLPFLEVYPAVLLAKLLGKKIYLVHNGDLVLPSNEGVVSRLTECLYYFVTDLSIKLSDGVVVQTEDYSLHSKLLVRNRGKWKIILPLFNIAEENTGAINRFKRKHNLKSKILVGFSGRFVEEKGVDILLNSISKVLEKVPKAHFIFAGEYKITYEKYWEKIKEKISENKKNITLLGLISNSRELAGFYKSLDVFVQPSRSDCFPSSLVEAQLYGIPAVVSDIPGARMIVKSTGMGIVVKPNSASELAGGIIKVIKNRKRYTRFSTKAKEILNDHITTLQYEKLFNS
jgi:glycosyltransferase involved in cell wall biosynthesis